MPPLSIIDSNDTGLRIAEEESIGVLPATPVWNPYEPNSYADLGAEVVTVARNPISADRQVRKGNKTDINVSAGFNTDLTQDNLQDILQGFFFATLRRKGEQLVTAVAATDNEFSMASTAGFFVGSLVWMTGFTNAQNNGLKRVLVVNTNTSIEVAETAVDEGSPPVTAGGVVVGFQFTAGDIDVTQATGGNLPRYTSTAKDLTELGLIPGEWFYVGGDGAALGFAGATNNGFKRARSIAAGVLVVDKSDDALVTEASTTETVQIFFGRVLKNETGTSIIRRTYQIERTLGAPDTDEPAEIQAQYEVGCFPNEFVLNVGTADKITADLSFIAQNEERQLSTVALKSGDRPTLASGEFLNTSSDVKRIGLTQIVPGEENTSPLFTFVEALTLTINNGGAGAKAIGVLGNAEVTKGKFTVSGQLTAYFNDIAAVNAVNNVDDVSLDMVLVRNNAGMAFDLPLVTLSDGRPTVEEGQSIKIPLGQSASTAATIDSGLNHTLLACFFDYLPNVAEA